MKEIKYVLLGLLVTFVMFALSGVLAVGIKYYPGAVVLVCFLGLSYWASRMVKTYYEN